MSAANHLGDSCLMAILLTPWDAVGPGRPFGYNPHGRYGDQQLNYAAANCRPRLGPRGTVSTCAPQSVLVAEIADSVPLRQNHVALLVYVSLLAYLDSLLINPLLAEISEYEQPVVVTLLRGLYLRNH